MSSDQLTNVSLNQSLSYNPLAPEVIMAYKIIIGMMCGIGTMSNLLACAAVFAFRRLRNPGNIFIANMSVTGVLYCAVVLPVRIATLINQSWVWQDWACTLLGGLAHCCGGIISFFFGAIAANRVVYIRHPRQYFRLYGKCGLTIQVTFIWFLGTFLCLVLPMSGTWGSFSYQPLIYSCALSHKGDQSFKYFLISFGLFVPMVVVICCYIAIYIHVKRVKNRLGSWGKDRPETMTVPGKGRVVPSVSENTFTGGASNNKQNTNQTCTSSLRFEELRKKEGSGKTTEDDDVFTVEKENSGRFSALSGQEDQTNQTGPDETLPQNKHVVPTEGELSVQELPGIPTSPTVTRAEARVRFSVVASPVVEKELAKVRGSAGSDQLNFQNRRRSRRASSQIFSSKQKKEGVRLAFMMVCAFFLCMACTLPYFIVNLLDERDNFPLGYMIAIMFISFAIAVNPFLYALMNVHYRKAYKVILMATFRCNMNIKNNRELALEHSCTVVE